MAKRGNARVSLCQANRDRMIMGHLSGEMNLKWNEERNEGIVTPLWLQVYGMANHRIFCDFFFSAREIWRQSCAILCHAAQGSHSVHEESSHGKKDM